MRADLMDDWTLIRLLYVLILFVFGLAAGSFLNVVIYRAPLGLSLLEPPSSCPKCGIFIAWYDNLPVAAWLVLRGKCRRCGAPISWRYPAVELLTGVLWAVEGWRLAGYGYGAATNAALGVLELFFISALVATVFIDCEWQIILDEISLGGAAVAVVAAPFLPALHAAETPASFHLRHRELYDLIGAFPAWLRSLASAALGGMFGAALMLGLYFLGNVAMKGQIEKAREKDPEIDSAIGLGDVKLLACLGAFLGWKASFLILMIGAILATLVGSAAKLASGDPAGKTGLAGLAERWRSGQSVFPLGPFLAAGAFIILFTRDGAGPPP
ncbi:MAG: prepilin peptidase [Planctomycetota bacterium]|jgi:leader peptidase (prepilin peptidase)/N-methyltransferase|nr:prepilin peptidase [Planctomycetota bacterium]